MGMLADALKESIYENLITELEYLLEKSKEETMGFEDDCEVGFISGQESMLENIIDLIKAKKEDI